MDKNLKGLVEKWREELTYRDTGVAARKTWEEIKENSTPEQQVRILEAQFINCNY